MNPISMALAPYKTTAIAIGAVAALGLVTYGMISSYNWAYENGVASEKQAWTVRENAELVAANEEILKLTHEAYTVRLLHSVALTNISSTYEEKLKHEKSISDKTIRDLSSGYIKLRDKHATPAAESTCPGAASETGTGTGEYHGQTGTELSATASTFLYGLAEEADVVVNQLAACQQTLEEDRRLCGVKSP
jgi:hypothetical protein